MSDQSKEKYAAGSFASNWQGDTSEPAPAGWAIDRDGWYLRLTKPGDVEISDRDEPHFGFVEGGKVYVRSAEYARNYDRGVVTPSF